MSRKIFLYTLLSLLACGVAALPIATLAAPTNLTIPVQDADGVFEADTSAFPHDPQLPSTYFPVRASDGVGWFNVFPISDTLQLLLEEIPNSYSPVRASDGVSWVNMEPITGVLKSLLNQIPTFYFPVRSSDGTFLGAFDYPVQLLDDTLPPRIFNVSIDRITGLFEWETDEFATSEVWYGSEVGSYTHVVSSTLWEIDHQFVLPGLTGDMQYFLIRSADRSGNLAEYYVPGYSISGNVQDENGVPIPNVVISVSPTQATLTDADGNYTLQGVPAGDYVITACHYAYDLTPDSISVTVSENLAGQDFVGKPYGPVVAGFIVPFPSGPAPLTVAFTNTSAGDYTTSLWDFGDGVTSTQESPSHTYALTGTYTVSLTVSGPEGMDTAVRLNYIAVYEPVNADFTAAPTSGVDSLTVVFTNTSTGDFTTSQWDFGDGGTSGLRDPTHTYTFPGVYTVTLTVSGPGGTDMLTRTNYITVYEPVNADFTAAATSGIGSLDAAFTNTSTGDYTTSLWEFGDGFTSTQKSPTHTYALPGTYDVTLTVSGPGGTDTEFRPGYIVVYEPVHAGFTASPTVGFAPLTVMFTNTSIGDYTTSQWNFGDGGTSTQESPTYIYTLPGVYTVTLTVSGPGGTDMSARTSYITVYEPVQADFTASPRDGVPPLTVHFTDTSSGGPVAAWEWAFGDGEISTLQHPTHTYTATGAYTVSLAVRVAGGSAAWPGGTDTLARTHFITVYTPVQAAFTAVPTSGVAPLTVVFTNTSTGDHTASLWDFGDDITSTQTSPTHIYTAAGAYTVTLTVSGPGGSDAETKAEYITVYEPVQYSVYLPLVLRNR